jgi:hypothetical protein
MARMPAPAEVLAQLDALIGSRFSKSARQAASAWATPLLLEDEESNIATEPPALGPALFLLGAADLLEKPPDAYVYQETDFVQARVDLAEE